MEKTKSCVAGCVNACLHDFVRKVVQHSPFGKGLSIAAGPFYRWKRMLVDHAERLDLLEPQGEFLEHPVIQLRVGNRAEVVDGEDTRLVDVASRQRVEHLDLPGAGAAPTDEL